MSQPLNEKERALMLELYDLSDLIIQRIGESKPVGAMISGFRQGCKNFVEAEGWESPEDSVYNDHA